MSMTISTGTTMTNTFIVPFDESKVDVLYITYKLGDNVVLEKTKDDCVFDSGNDNVYVELSQEDTLKFYDENESEIQIQIRLRLTDGQAFKSNVVKANTDDLLKVGVI